MIATVNCKIEIINELIKHVINYKQKIAEKLYFELISVQC